MADVTRKQFATLVAGDSATVRVKNATKTTDGTDSSVDLTAWSVELNIYSDRGGTSLLTKDDSGDIDTSVGSTDEMDISFSSSDTTSLNGGNKDRWLWYDIEISSGSENHTIARGEVRVKPDD